MSVVDGALGAPAWRKFAPAGPSPVSALVSAFGDTIQILFNPFDPRQWIKLGFACLFLGGGASWGAIHWSLGALPGDWGVEAVLLQLRGYLTRYPLLGLLVFVLALTLGVLLVYMRAFCRFLLVDVIVTGRVRFRRGWRELRPVARTYFRWLLGALLLLGVVLGGGTLVTLPYVRADQGKPLVASLLSAGILLAQATIGLAAGLLITLTDDLVVPIIYAERVTLLAAWKKLARSARGEVGAFTLYFFLRFAVSVAIGLSVLFFLFPALVALFSGAVILAVLILLSLRLVGLDWAWTPLTTLLAGTALTFLVGVLLIVMGVAGMPGQVFLQSFGIRFIAPRVPALQAQLDPTGYRSPGV